jgi:putative SOS response-associated peptidase YedK
MAAGEPMRQIHDRQPVILDPAVYDAWLDQTTQVDAAKKGVLLANLDGELQFHQRLRGRDGEGRYSGFVNGPTEDDHRSLPP